MLDTETEHQRLERLSGRLASLPALPALPPPPQAAPAVARCTVCDEAPAEGGGPPHGVCRACKRRCGRCGLGSCHCGQDAVYMERCIAQMMADPWALRLLPWLDALRSGYWFLSGRNGCRAQVVFRWWKTVRHGQMAGQRSQRMAGAVRHMCAVAGHLYQRLTPLAPFRKWVEDHFTPKLTGLSKDLVALILAYVFPDPAMMP